MHTDFIVTIQVLTEEIDFNSDFVKHLINKIDGDLSFIHKTEKNKYVYYQKLRGYYDTYPIEELAKNLKAKMNKFVHPAIQDKFRIKARFSVAYKVGYDFDLEEI